MKLCVPINSKSNISKLIAQGADEFYCSYLFQDAPGLASALSRHKGKKANFLSKKDIFTANKKISAAKKNIHIALNEHFFPEKFLPNILSDVNDFIKNGINRFIISDINLLLLLQKDLSKINLTASTGMHLMNSHAIDFFKELGISRIILPRHLTLKKIVEIIKNHPDMEFEIFFKNISCPNIDGFCSSLHGPIGGRTFPGLCDDLEFKDPRINFSQNLTETACAACSLWDLLKTRHKSIFLKIVGRSDCYNNIIEKDVLFFNTLNNFKNIRIKKSFQEKTKFIYKEIYGASCLNNCYY